MGFSSFQREIYHGDSAPPYTVNLSELEAVARSVMEPSAYAYLAGSAGIEDTTRANLSSFTRWRLVPRMLCSTANNPSTEISLFGAKYPAPVLLAPVAAQTIMHPYGELATARAAASLGVPMVLSSYASHPLEEVATVGGPRWFQLYWPHDDSLTLSLLNRATAAGYTALVVTLDTWLVGWRPRELDLAYNPFMRGIGVATPLSDPVYLAGAAAGLSPLDAARLWGSLVQGRTHTWSDLAFLRSSWPGPILLKGILHPDDARHAVAAGMDGIIVSNHGGRQLDGAISSLDALPAVVSAVSSAIPVLLDSGLRTGADAVKALALGATAVLLGRPYLWGLAVDGEAGVRHVLRSFLAELELTMTLTGRPTPEELDPSDLAREER